MSSTEFTKVIGDFWKWFSKHYKTELHKDDLEDLFWANAVNDMEEILKKYGWMTVKKNKYTVSSLLQCFHRLYKNPEGSRKRI